VTGVEFTAVNYSKASKGQRLFVNVSLDGEPYGQLWTFQAKGEKHPWHSKPLDGDHQTHPNLQKAKQRMLTEEG